MPLTIHKYPFSLSAVHDTLIFDPDKHLFVNDQRIIVPAGSVFLSLGRDSLNTPGVWLLVDPDAEKRQRRIRLVFTGQPLPDRTRWAPEKEFRGTMIGNAGFVYHVFMSEEEFIQ